MERAFRTFPKSEFVKDLTAVIGVSVDAVRNESIRDGCVIYEGELPETAVQQLAEMYRKWQLGEEVPEEFRKFFMDHLVKKLTATKDYDGTKLNLPLTRKSPPPLPAKAVVFVHGWRGNDASFEKLPDYLKENSNLACHVFHYPTGIFTHSPSIVRLAGSLTNYLLELPPAQEWAFITHSMGGLVTKKMIVNQVLNSRRLDQRARMVAFLATPHTGVSLASVVGWIPGLTSDQVRELKGDSTFLDDLMGNWGNWKINAGTECKIFAVRGSNDKLVPHIDAKTEDPNAVDLLGRDHRSVCKPKDNEDDLMKTIRRLLREAKFLPAQS